MLFCQVNGKDCGVYGLMFMEMLLWFGTRSIPDHIDEYKMRLR